MGKGEGQEFTITVEGFNMDIKIMHSVVFPTYVGEEKMNLAPPIRSEGGKVINSLIIIILS